MDKVDFVVTWVDDTDQKWVENKQKYMSKSDLKLNDASRYRDWGIFKYWFRAVEKHAPWVNKVYLITEGHLPEWINTEYDKLICIKHSDYIDKKFLPTFNSNVIELNIANISSLSEQFVMFNDDMVLNSDVEKSDFFLKGLPRDTGVFSPIIPISGTISNTLVNNVGIINQRFNSRKIIKENFAKFYNFKYGKNLVKNLFVIPWKNVLGFYDLHLPISYLKSEFQDTIAYSKEEVEVTSFNKFREATDISHWLVRYTQLSKGKFIPRSTKFGVMYGIETDFDKIKEDVEKSKHKVICLEDEDGDSIKSFEKTKQRLLSLYETKYPEKSRFER